MKMMGKQGIGQGHKRRKDKRTGRRRKGSEQERTGKIKVKGEGSYRGERIDAIMKDYGRG